MTREHTCSSVDGGTLHLVVPMTPSGNSILSWVRQRSGYLAQHKRDAQMSVWAACLQALGYVPAVRGEPWADRATISIVRCSSSRKRLDDDNVVCGCKYVRDALIHAKVVPDDNPCRLTMVLPLEDRRRGQWGGWHGPATHLIVRR